MPLPPAPTQRASRLTSKAFEQADSSVEDAPATTSQAPASVAEKSSSKNRSRKASTLTTVTSSTLPPSVAQAAPTATKKSAAPKRRSGPRKLFVLDTNVLMHDPMSLFRFEEHDVFLPMIVLEELDGHKKGMTEVARNARQTSRSLDALAAAQGFDMAQGLPLNTTGYADAQGKLFFQTQALDLSLPLALPPGKADNQILGVVRALEQTHKPREVVLVSKDINMRVKARALGLQAEDYQNDKTLEDGDLLFPVHWHCLPTSGSNTAKVWRAGSKALTPSTASMVPSCPRCSSTNLSTLRLPANPACMPA